MHSDSEKHTILPHSWDKSPRMLFPTLWTLSFIPEGPIPLSHGVSFHLVLLGMPALLEPNSGGLFFPFLCPVSIFLLAAATQIYNLPTLLFCSESLVKLPSSCLLSLFLQSSFGGGVGCFKILLLLRAP